jgi:ABC-2 type transport system ATP-binding protein
MSVIETRGLTRRFGSIVAVEDLDLTVEEGEIYGFLGPNGAGKTTTINMLLGLVYPSSGSVEVFGRDATSEIRAIHSRIGVLPTHTDLYDRLTARKHLEFVIGVKGADDDPEALLERVDLLDAADRKAGDFSSGMEQRLKLAMALSGDPDLLILDEPTTGLDPNGAREMRRIITQENERGATVFFSSHIMEQVEAVCDRVGILRRGQLVAEDTITELRRSTGATVSMTVEVDGDPEAALESLRPIEGVEEVTAEPAALEFVLTDPMAKGRTITAIVEAGLSVVDFAVEEQSLEDIFASYTADAEAPADQRGPPGPDQQPSDADQQPPSGRRSSQRRRPGGRR